MNMSTKGAAAQAWLEAGRLRDQEAREVLASILAMRETDPPIDVERILFYLHDHLFDRRLERTVRERLRLDEAAFEAFGEHFDISVEKLIEDKRMEIARRMVDQSDLSQRVIANRLGFAYPRHLGRAFTRIYGMNMTEYREAQRRGPVRPAPVSMEVSTSFRDTHPELFRLSPQRVLELIIELLESYFPQSP